MFIFLVRNLRNKEFIVIEGNEVCVIQKVVVEDCSVRDSTCHSDVMQCLVGYQNR